MKIFFNILFLVSILIIFGCKKKVVEVDQNFEGVWLHRFDNEKNIYFTINKNSSGIREWYTNGHFEKDEHTRRWRVKNNYLCGEGQKLKIDKYPTSITSIYINNYDTVYPNQFYIILDGEVYRKK